MQESVVVEEGGDSICRYNQAHTFERGSRRLGAIEAGELVSIRVGSLEATGTGAYGATDAAGPGWIGGGKRCAIGAGRLGAQWDPNAEAGLAVELGRRMDRAAQ